MIRRKYTGLQKLYRGVSSRIPNMVHYFKRTAYFPNFLVSSMSGGTGTAGARADILRLQDVPNYTEFTALFDQYKILKVVVKLMPRGNVSEVSVSGSTNQASFQNIYAVVDKDDSSTPSSVSQMLEYSKVKIRRSHQQLKLIFTPASLAETYNNGITSGYAMNMKPKWLDCSYSGIQHYGYKTYLEPPNVSPLVSLPVTTTYDCLVTYYLAFQNVI